MLGVDFAPSALETARVLAATRGIDADYRLGDLVATGLADGAADSVVVIDAIQFPLIRRPPTGRSPGFCAPVAGSC